MTRPNELVELLARRAGRTVFGLAMIAGAIALVRGALGDHFDARESLGITWVTAIGAGLMAWVAARFVAHRWRADALKYAGLVAPTIGLALIAPLSVHLLVALVLRSSGAVFDSWVRMSLVVAGPACAFAIAATVRVVGLIDAQPSALGDVTGRPLGAGYVYLIVVLVSCLPFIAIILPPVLVALTGIAMLPILYLPEGIVARECAVFEATPPIAYVRA